MVFAMPDCGHGERGREAPVAPKSGNFEPIDKVLTPSYLCGITSQAGPAGLFMLPAAQA
jgi:hypothetical protein